MQVEILEGRRMFATGPVATLGTDGTLTIAGTTSDDYVTIAGSRDGSTISVLTATRGHWSGRTRTPYTATDIKKIVIDGGDGDDLIRLGKRLNVPATITGGAGDDNITAGRGDDTVDGGAGEDHIVGGLGNDKLTGGDDNDFIDGGRGDDTITGDAGDDRLLGGEGDDNISGGDGADYINGGYDNDTLNGDAGNDEIIAIDYGDADTVDGGANDTPTTDEPGDVCVADVNDTVTNVEDKQSDNSDNGPVFGSWFDQKPRFFFGGRFGRIRFGGDDSSDSEDPSV